MPRGFEQPGIAKSAGKKGGLASARTRDADFYKRLAQAGREGRIKKIIKDYLASLQDSKPDQSS